MRGRRILGASPAPANLTYFGLGTGAFLALYLPQPILPLLDGAFGTPPPVTGLTMTAALLGFAAAGLLPEGEPSRTLRWASWLIALASLVAALSPVFASLLVARAAQGIGIGLLIAGGLADIARRAPAGHAGRLTGAMIGGTAIGGLLSRLSGYSAFLIGWRGAFAVGGLVALVLATLALKRLGLTSQASPRIAAGGPQESGASAEAQPAPGPPRESSQALAAHPNPRPAARTPAVIVLAGLFILFVNIAVFDLLPYRLSGPPFHLPTYVADLVYLAFVPATGTAYVAGPAVDRFGPRVVAIVTCGLGVGCLLVGLLPSIVAAAVMAVGSISGAVSLHICHSGVAAKHGRVAVGRYLTAYYVGGAASAPIAASAYQAFGWPGAVAPLAAAWLVVAMLALRGDRRVWKAPSVAAAEVGERVGG